MHIQAVDTTENMTTELGSLWYDGQTSVWHLMIDCRELN